MPELEIEVISDAARQAAVKPEWDDLHPRLADGSLFLSHFWYDCWWRHFSLGADMRLLVARRKGRAVGIAPLMLRRLSLHGLPVRALVFMANGNSLHNDLLVDEEHRDRVTGALCRFLLARREEWDVLQLNHVPEESPNLCSFVERLKEEKASFLVRQSFDSPYLAVQGSFEALLSARSQRVRKTLRNVRNTLQRAGAVEVREVTGWDDYLSVREEVRRVAAGSWTQKVGDSLAVPANAAFFDDLARGAAETGGLKLWLLYLDAKAVAFEFHLRGCGKQHALRASFDEEFARLSPGAYLEAEILKRLFENPGSVARFDFGGSFDAYKRRWSDSSVNHATLTVFNGGLRSRAAAFHERVVVGAARRLRDRVRKKR